MDQPTTHGSPNTIYATHLNLNEISQVKKPINLALERIDDLYIHHIINPNPDRYSLNNTVQYKQNLETLLVYISTLVSFPSPSTTRVGCPAAFERDRHQLWLDNSDISLDPTTTTPDDTSPGGIQALQDMNKSRESSLLHLTNYPPQCTIDTLLHRADFGK